MTTSDAFASVALFVLRSVVAAFRWPSLLLPRAVPSCANSGSAT
jgi:hypothetical protein